MRQGLLKRIGEAVEVPETRMNLRALRVSIDAEQFLSREALEEEIRARELERIIGRAAAFVGECLPSCGILAKGRDV